MSYGNVIDGIVFAGVALFLAALGIRSLVQDWAGRSRPGDPGEPG